MQRTVDRIVAASKLPLSIVIVGVGGADFTNMVSFYNLSLSLSHSHFFPSLNIICLHTSDSQYYYIHPLQQLF